MARSTSLSGPLVQLWRRARRQKELPRPELLKRALTATGYQALELDFERKTARLTKPNMRLDLGGIGMGYAVDEALKVLAMRGIRSAMVDASGDIGVSEAPPGRMGWVIGILPDQSGKPTRFVSLVNGALTTSSDAVQHVEIDGVRYSHIVNPKTGLGLTDRSAATVIARDCTTADSYATAASVLGPTLGLKLIQATTGAEAHLHARRGRQAGDRRIARVQEVRDQRAVIRILSHPFSSRQRAPDRRLFVFR